MKTKSKPQLEVIEVDLVDWMFRQDKKVFSKKEIAQKYSNLWKGKRKNISIQQLKDLGEKFKLKDMIVQDNKGHDHYLFGEPSNELSS